MTPGTPVRWTHDRERRYGALGALSPDDDTPVRDDVIVLNAGESGVDAMVGGAWSPIGEGEAAWIVPDWGRSDPDGVTGRRGPLYSPDERVTWQCAAPLAGNGDPVLFWSEVTPPRGSPIGKGYTLRRDGANGHASFTPVSLSQALSNMARDGSR